MSTQVSDREHRLQLNAIIQADAWFWSLPEQEQFYVKEIASKCMSQGAAMLIDGDRRRGIDMFSEAFSKVVLKMEPHDNGR